MLNLCSSLLSKYMTKYKLIWFIVYEPESDQVSATYRKEIYFFVSYLHQITSQITPTTCLCFAYCRMYSKKMYGLYLILIATVFF